MTDTDKETLARLAFEVGKQQAALQRLGDLVGTMDVPMGILEVVSELKANHGRMVSVIYGMREDGE